MVSLLVFGRKRNKKRGGVRRCKLFTAINEKTNELVNSLEIYNNASYLKPRKEKWYSPESEILNLDELKDQGKINDIKDIEVFYVSEGKKEYKTKEGTFLIRPHFNIKDKSEFGIISQPQDLLHHKLSNWLFNYIQSKEANFEMIYSTYYVNKKKKYNKINIKDLPINILDCEDTIEVTNGKKVRADVFQKFHKKRILFGEGIVFEIQLTKQKDEKQYERTLDRALAGFSVCWLNKNNFEDGEEEWVLSEEQIYIEPFASILKKQSKKTFDKWRDVTQQTARLITEKINEQTSITDIKIGELKELLSNSTNILNSQSDLSISKLNKMMEEPKKIFEFIKQKKSMIMDSLVNESDEYKVSIRQEFKEISDMLNNIRLERLKIDKLMEGDKRTFRINNWLTKEGQLCPKCHQGNLIHREGTKFGKDWEFIGCSKFPNCKYVINKPKGTDDE